MLRNRWGFETHEASLAVVHGSVQSYATIRDMVFASRGFTMSANTRRAPNALNFLRQSEVLANAGMALENQFQELGNQNCPVQDMICFFLLPFRMSSFQDWENASALARAFQMGAKEAAAVSNLQARTDKIILERFKQVADRRGLRAFVTHDALAKGILNLGFSSSQGNTEAWDAVMTTSDDNRLATQLDEFCHQICK